ncbi:hypothetical protein A6R68_20029, partial [Neotoma lepida]
MPEWGDILVSLAKWVYMPIDVKTLCSPSKSDSNLEPLGARIQHLQKLSQKLDKVIKAEEN